MHDFNVRTNASMNIQYTFNIRPKLDMSPTCLLEILTLRTGDIKSPTVSLSLTTIDSSFE